VKAVRIHGFNETPALDDASVPEIGPDQVLVRVGAAALNPLDIHIASGFAAQFFPVTFPYTLGSDFAGVIERVGEAVTNWRVGDAVICWSDPLMGGGLANYAAVSATACVALPPTLSAAEGAGIPTAASTAWHALFTAGGLKAGETVLIHAGAGGTGTFAVQFAHKAGAYVIATASGDGIELARSLGAERVIDYTAEDFTAQSLSVDLVLDLVGGETQARSYDVLKSGGRLVSTAMPPDQAVAGARGVTASMFYVKPYAHRLIDVVRTIEDQAVKVVLDRTASFDGLGDAFSRQQSGRARGKIVVSAA
jgi:NADPH:quinone reductase-like Zn-dependent oxidoreductase